MRASNIKDFILNSLPDYPANIVAQTAEKFSVTRTTVHRHLDTLIKAGKVIKSGTTKNSYYVLASSLSRKFTYSLTPQLDEFRIFSLDFLSIINGLAKNNQDIIQYCFTEITNNAIDHSKGKTLKITSQIKHDQLILSIADNGIGIFKNIYDYYKLDSLRESILQLTKGKMTTDPLHHSGEGIFFSSRLTHLFEIHANGLHFIRNNKENDWTISENKDTKQGTQVIMHFSLYSTLQMVDVFKQFQNNDTLQFDRTEIIVELSHFKEELFISRSQAKRVLRNLDRFKKVTLDFKHVRMIGQGFVDEIFRVYQNVHPEIQLQYINANDDIKFMIERGLKS